MAIKTTNVTIDGQELIRVKSDRCKKIQHTGDGNLYSVAYTTSYKNGDFTESTIDVPYLSTGTIITTDDIRDLGTYLENAISSDLSVQVIEVIDQMDGADDGTMTIDNGEI